MQADDFEKKIKNKMEEFGLVPDNVIWKEVSIKIEKAKQKRRVLFYILFAGFLLLAGSTAWWFISKENIEKFAKKDIDDTKKDIANINNNAAKIENYETKQNAKNISRKLNKLNNPSIKNSSATIVKNSVFTRHGTLQKKIELQKVIGDETKNKVFTKNSHTKVIAKELIEDRENNNQNIHNKENLISKTLLPHKFYNPDLATRKKAGTSINSNSNENAELKKNAAANTTTTKTTKIKNNTIWNVGFTVYGGSSNNRSGVPLLENIITPNNYDLQNAVNNSGNYSNYLTTANNFKRGFSFGLGIFAKRQITKKINLSAGVDYHSYTAKLTVGNKVNQQRNFYDSSVEKAIDVTEFYSAGGSVNYSNKYQFLQLPVNLEYQVNKNRQKPFLISAGISPGLLISSNALHANPTAIVYYVDKQQFNHLQLSAQVGFSFPLISSLKYLLSAGPSIQYSFTNASKAAADASQHLFFTGIKANIILK